MYTVEFQAKIKNGTIEIPGRYRQQFGQQVRVILMAEEENLEADMIARLLNQPLQVNEFQPLTREDAHSRH